MGSQAQTPSRGHSDHVITAWEVVQRWPLTDSTRILGQEAKSCPAHRVYESRSIQRSYAYPPRGLDQARRPGCGRTYLRKSGTMQTRKIKDVVDVDDDGSSQQ